MKIAYLIHWNEGPDSGVYKKVTAQALAWASLGHEPALFLFTSRHGESWEEAAGGGIPVIVETYRGKPGRLARFGPCLQACAPGGPMSFTIASICITLRSPGCFGNFLRCLKSTPTMCPNWHWSAAGGCVITTTG
ncbi:hypothetical protein HMSSN036_13390 [Paenibacillus macerans]|nr:hypothetical protein HMSSN036_13390 [Paenibacillus macerans]